MGVISISPPLAGMVSAPPAQTEPAVKTTTTNVRSVFELTIEPPVCCCELPTIIVAERL
jgi:hypothetical protein